MPYFSFNKLLVKFLSSLFTSVTLVNCIGKEVKEKTEEKKNCCHQSFCFSFLYFFTLKKKFHQKM